MTEEEKRLRERERFVKAFNDTMFKIWKEKIRKLDVWSTGALYKSVSAYRSVTHDAEYSQAEFSEKFMTHGIYQQLGVGRETARGNPGDIGRLKVRRRKPWIQPKWNASVHNIREFMAESFALQYIGIFADTFSNDGLRRIAENSSNASSARNVVF